MPTARFSLLLFLIYTTSTLTQFDQIQCLAPIIPRLTRLPTPHPAPLTTPLTTRLFLSSCHAALNSMAINPPSGSSSNVEFHFPSVKIDGHCLLRIDRHVEKISYSLDAGLASSMYHNTKQIMNRMVKTCYEDGVIRTEDLRGGGAGTVTRSRLRGEEGFFNYRIMLLVL